jgi:hypothetical protein
MPLTLVHWRMLCIVSLVTLYQNIQKTFGFQQAFSSARQLKWFGPKYRPPVVNPLTTARFLTFDFFTFRSLVCACLIRLGPYFHATIAWACERAGIYCQPMSTACSRVSASKSKWAENRLFQSHDGRASTDGKPSVVMERHKGGTDCHVATYRPSSLQPALGWNKL